MIIRVSNHADRIRLIAIENMKGAFGNGGALRFCQAATPLSRRKRTFAKRGHDPSAVQSSGQNTDELWPSVSVEVW
jgi:hypothetical protein